MYKKYNRTDLDKLSLRQAIDMAQLSYDKGSFPAGAVIVKDGKVITETTSASFPKINFHAESKAIDDAQVESVIVRMYFIRIYGTMPDVHHQSILGGNKKNSICS